MDTILLGKISDWVKEQESIALKNGVPLTFSQTTDAYALGVDKPEHVRVMYVDMGQVPVCPFIDESHLGVGYGQNIPGMCARNGIWITSKNKFLLCHELRHTVQYHQCGSIEEFIRQYVKQCMTFGYGSAPFERDANRAADMIANDHDRDLPMPGCFEWF